MSSARLTAQGKLQAPIPNIVEITPDKRWRVSLMTISWDGSLESSSFGRRVYWWDPRTPETWPRPVYDPNVETITGGVYGFDEPPGTTSSTTVSKGTSGATQIASIDSPADYRYPCLVRLSATNVNDDPDRVTWYWFAPWDTTPITLTDGAALDIDSKFRAAVTVGTRVAIDGGSP